MPRPNVDQTTGRGEIHPRFPGEGVLMRHSSRPTNQCKGRSEPITENSSDAPPRRADVPGPVTRRGTGGATVNSPTFRYPMPAADPRTGRGESAFREDTEHT